MVKNYLLYINDLSSLTSLSPLAQIKFSFENILSDEDLLAFNHNDRFIVISEKRSLVLTFESLNQIEITFKKVLEIEKETSLASITNPFKEITDEEYNEFLQLLLSDLLQLDSPIIPQNQAEEVERASVPLISSFNIIYYGAPGTGKSYKVDQIIKDLDKQFYERVTFHPEYDNASFIGGYKPISEKDEEEKDVIKYEFVPQAFANIYKRAWLDLENQYYLVIEEINRGNCAEIFGELFQLLDRNSGYTVAPSNELHKHLVEEFGDENHEGIIKGLQLPPNLAILATMNTSDQSLFPMDSAFKRRWDWEYVPICYKEKYEKEDNESEGKENKSFNFEIDLGNGSKYRWIDFIKIINKTHIASEPNLGMDKCIGNYFVKAEKGDSSSQNSEEWITISLKQFINKVIFYLWNDVFKDEDNKVFESNGSYEDFFPVLTNGLTKVKELFERLELAPILEYPSREEEQDLGQVAEENQPLTE